MRARYSSVAALFLGLAASVGCASAPAAEPAKPAAVAPAPAPANAAATAAAERADRMAKIAFLAGTWKGEGWRNLPTGRVTFAQTVLAEPRVSGLAISIQGQSERPDGARGAGSFAVVTWNEKTGVYDFRSFVGGELTHADGQLIAPDTFQWLARIPGSWLRFTVKVTGDAWDEKGERSTDNGATWSPTNEVKLTRLP